MELWENNKRFVLMVVGGLAVALFGWNVAQSGINDSSRRTSQANDEISSALVVINETFLRREAEAARESELLQGEDQLSRRLRPLIAPEPRRDLPEDNPGAKLHEMISNEKFNIAEKGRNRGTKIVAKDWGISAQITLASSMENLKELQVRLEATERLLTIAIDAAQVREINKVRQLPSTRMTVPRSEGEKDIELLPIEITVYGTARALARFTFELSREPAGGTGDFFYLREADISSGRKATPGKRGDRKTSKTTTTSLGDTSTRRGVFTCCAIRIMNAEEKKKGARGTRLPRRRIYRPRRR